MLLDGSNVSTVLTWVRPDLDKHLTQIRTQIEHIANSAHLGDAVENTAEHLVQLKFTFEALMLQGAMLVVEEMSWKGIGKCGMTVERSRTYYDCMLRRLAASGNGRVMFARQGERDIGYIFGGLAGDVYRGQQFSYAQDWKSFSIGNLLQVELIKWLCEENIRRYDMGPVMDYKNHWAENNYPITAVVLQRNRPGRDGQR